MVTPYAVWAVPRNRRPTARRSNAASVPSAAACPRAGSLRAACPCAASVPSASRAPSAPPAASLRAACPRAGSLRAACPRAGSPRAGSLRTASPCAASRAIHIPCSPSPACCAWDRGTDVINRRFDHVPTDVAHRLGCGSISVIGIPKRVIHRPFDHPFPAVDHARRSNAGAAMAVDQEPERAPGDGRSWPRKASQQRRSHVGRAMDVDHESGQAATACAACQGKHE